MLAPLTSLVGECGQTKVTRAKGTKKVSWHLDEVHQRALDHIKATIAREVVLAYPDFSKVFEIYTDAWSKQLGAVITQENRPIVFFSWKLSTTQRKYSVTKIRLEYASNYDKLKIKTILFFTRGFLDKKKFKKLV
jgi:hypothetical protein